MDIIQKMLNIEETNYSSGLNTEGLKNRIEDLYHQNAMRVAGRLTSENEFTIYDKWIIVGWSMPNLNRKAAYIYGKITEGEEGTLVNLKVTPNALLPIFSILSMLMGVVITLRALLNTEDDKFFLTLGVALIVIGMLYYPIGTLLKNRLLKRVVRSLDLKKV